MSEREEMIKWIVLILVVLALVIAAGMSRALGQSAFDVNKVDLSKISVAEIEATLEHKERLFDELLSILKDKNPLVIEQLRSSLKSANDATLEAAKHAAELQRERDDAVAARDHLLGKLHLAKVVFSVLVAALIAFVVMRAPSALTIYGGIGLAVVVIGGIWVWL